MRTLRQLFSYTQTKQAKVLGAWVILPCLLVLTSREMWSLALITHELVRQMTFWETFPYVTACATVFAVTGCARQVVSRLRKEHPLF